MYIIYIESKPTPAALPGDPRAVCRVARVPLTPTRKTGAMCARMHGSPQTENPHSDAPRLSSHFTVTPRGESKKDAPHQ